MSIQKLWLTKVETFLWCLIFSWGVSSLKMNLFTILPHVHMLGFHRKVKIPINFHSKEELNIQRLGTHIKYFFNLHCFFSNKIYLNRFASLYIILKVSHPTPHLCVTIDRASVTRLSWICNGATNICSPTRQKLRGGAVHPSNEWVFKVYMWPSSRSERTRELSLNGLSLTRLFWFALIVGIYRWQCVL